MGGAPEPPCAWEPVSLLVIGAPAKLPHGIMGQILVPGTWGRGVPGTADKGPTWASYRSTFQAGYSLAGLAPFS